jgi:hypothetical protein
MAGTATLKLYEASEALALVDAWLDENEEALIAADGDISALPVLKELLEKAEGDFETKIQYIALRVRSLLASAEAAKREAARLAARTVSFAKAAESLKNYAKLHMLQTGRLKVTGSLATVWVQANGQASVTIPETLDAASLREGPCASFVRIIPPVEETYAIDRDAIVMRWKAWRSECDAAVAKAAKDATVVLPPSGLPEGVTVEIGQHLRVK